MTGDILGMHVPAPTGVLELVLDRLDDSTAGWVSSDAHTVTADVGRWRDVVPLTVHVTYAPAGSDGWPLVELDATTASFSDQDVTIGVPRSTWIELGRPRYIDARLGVDR